MLADGEASVGAKVIVEVEAVWFKERDERAFSGDLVASARHQLRSCSVARVGVRKYAKTEGGFEDMAEQVNHTHQR